MMQLSREERYISLETMTNTRDLGGYETQDGMYTKTKRYVRSASPANLSDEDLKTLYQYGVRVEIDLRGETETTHQPSRLHNYEDIEYYSVNLLDGMDINVLPENIREYQDLSGFYIYILEACKERMKEVFSIIMNHQDTTLLFNCSAGKDRTGVIAALLLDLAGCHEYDIVKDYSESYENNLPMINRLKEMIDEEHEEFLSSKPTTMIRFLGYLRENYGGAKEYLRRCGIDELDLEDLIDNFKI